MIVDCCPQCSNRVEISDFAYFTKPNTTLCNSCQREVDKAKRDSKLETKIAMHLKTEWATDEDKAFTMAKELVELLED